MIRRSRFTLLEIIVAITVFSLVMLILYAFSSQVSNSWVKIRAEQRRFGALLALDRSVDSMLANAIPFTWPVQEGEEDEKEERIVFQGAEDRILFAYVHRVNPGSDGALRFVELLAEDGNLVARHYSRPFREWADVAEMGEVTILARDIVSVRFQYADFSPDEDADWEDRLEWGTRWDEDEENPREEIPLAIMMTINWQDGRVESWLRRTSGQGYRERFGKWKPRKKE